MIDCTIPGERLSARIHVHTQYKCGLTVKKLEFIKIYIKLKIGKLINILKLFRFYCTTDIEAKLSGNRYYGNSLNILRRREKQYS